MAHLILDIKTTIDFYKSLILKMFDGNTFKIKAASPVYVKKHKAIFLVVCLSDVHFGFDDPSFACPIGRARKNCAPENSGA